MKIYFASVVPFLIVAVFASLSFGFEDDSVNVASPPIFRGMMVVHFPLAALPRDSIGGSYFWIPIPEMGFSFCPTIQFPEKNGWWEFPIHILTFFPFLEKYGAMGDVSIGAGFQVPPYYKMGIAYRFIEGKFYPVGGSFYAHIAETDFKLPIKGLPGTGVKFDWIMQTKLKMTAPYTSDGKSYDRYQGSAFAVAIYWKFNLKYGQLTTSYRVVLGSKIVGTESQKQTSYQVRTRSVSAFELEYTYP